MHLLAVFSSCVNVLLPKPKAILSRTHLFNAVSPVSLIADNNGKHISVTLAGFSSKTAETASKASICCLLFAGRDRAAVKAVTAGFSVGMDILSVHRQGFLIYGRKVGRGRQFKVTMHTSWIDKGSLKTISTLYTQTREKSAFGTKEVSLARDRQRLNLYNDLASQIRKVVSRHFHQLEQ